jgi:hypothetical protein
MTYTCPVCGFQQMPFPPADHNICSCCGTEFGYHDRVRTPQSLRKAWTGSGCRWFSKALQPPAGWNPFVQMLNAGLVDITLGSSEDLILPSGSGPSDNATTASSDVGTIAA